MFSNKVHKKPPPKTQIRKSLIDFSNLYKLYHKVCSHYSEDSANERGNSCSNSLLYIHYHLLDPCFWTKIYLSYEYNYSHQDLSSALCANGNYKGNLKKKELTRSKSESYLHTFHYFLQLIFRLTPLTSAAKSYEKLVNQKLCNIGLIFDAL